MIIESKEIKTEWTNWREQEVCAIEEFFRREREAGRDTSVCMLACYCPRCSPRM